jgi:uncharacterized protein
MSKERGLAAVGFHGGELAVQRRAGVRAEAARLEPMLTGAELRAGVATFLTGATLAALTACDLTGRMWTSVVQGGPGFLHPVSPTTLEIRSTPHPGDPLYRLPPGQSIGIVVIDFARRRRVRINGTLSGTSQHAMTVVIDQVYGNCPRYIHEHRLDNAADVNTHYGPLHQRITADDRRLIEAGDTFFFGTTHPERGNDASHRGGPPGFLEVRGERLWWPDYPGNNMFNSLGNLAVDETAALLVVDFRAGRTLQLSGIAGMEWDSPGSFGADDHTGRGVYFQPHQMVGASVPALQAAQGAE